ncbi:S-adenosyl-L-methionine-dependent methyltransferase [Violaceomyces palustris]|uniref:S-adenosyl-L-methionine-dependent methyltransferase n=1 Tax=Violaceomyces palustris TaxID=1673888 RepID=A0ACD0NTV9_9BASI|nr:S-adenosyl-L-methionine-dependent methyltransferase [Violaceomyces palustris]
MSLPLPSFARLALVASPIRLSTTPRLVPAQPSFSNPLKLLSMVESVQAVIGSVRSLSTSVSPPPPSKRARSKSPENHPHPPVLASASAVAPSGEPSSESTQGSTSHHALPAATAAPPQLTPEQRQKRKELERRSKNKRKDYLKSFEKSGREPVEFDIEEMVGKQKFDEILSKGEEFRDALVRDEELEVEIVRLNSHGDGLALAPSGDWVIAVPNTLPGEKVLCRIISNERIWSRAVLVKVLVKNESLRRDELVGCKYFGTCGGCQYQMLTYQDQLNIKKRVVENAFKHYSGLDASLIPAVMETMPSPKQYNYRTKLTPHFDLPQELRKRRGGGRRKGNNQPSEKDAGEYEFNIGFDCVGTKRVMDIEECPIATATINKDLPGERERVKKTIHTYKNGATILLRDSLREYTSVAEDNLVADSDVSASPDTVTVTDHKATVKERVAETLFESPAGTFFQNNRSILPSLIEYVRDQVLAFVPPPTEGGLEADRYLVDAYCGSGLFSLCLAKIFKEVSGVEISSESIKYANKNAELNGITNAKFLAGEAEKIFAQIQYPSDQTTVIIDPPRRGCDEAFITQLVNLGPANIVYVSCNVHTQARDVGSLLSKAPEYEILSIRGADLFPQTYHVEGVCVLRKKRKD